MKSFFRILRTNLPKTALIFSLTSSFKAIRLQDHISQEYKQNIDTKISQTQINKYSLPVEPKIVINEEQASRKKKENQNQEQNDQLKAAQEKVKQLSIIQNMETSHKSSSNQIPLPKKISIQVKQGNLSQQMNKQKDSQQIVRQNLAIIGQNIPKNIIKYLSVRGLKIQVSSEIEKQQIIMYNSKRQSKIMKIDQLSINRDPIFEIGNFLTPIRQIFTLEEAQQLLHSIEKDQSIISTYIPIKQEYDRQIDQKTRSSFDSFTKLFYADLKKLQNQFYAQKQLSSTKKNEFVIIRNRQAANYLKVNINKIGIPHLLYNSYEYTGNQPNCKIDKNNYNSINLERILNSSNNNPHIISAKISQASNQYINYINVKEDLIDKIRQIRQMHFNIGQDHTRKDNACKKLMVIKVDDQKQQIQRNIDKILQKVGRLMKNQVVIVKTQNEQMLKQVLHISPSEYATIRLFDLTKTESPIIASSLHSKSTQNELKSSISYPFYNRYVMKGPFQIQNICQFINNCQKSHEPYYQKNLKLSIIKPFYPGDFAVLINKALLFQKYGCNGCSLAQNLISKVIKLQNLINRRNKKLTKQISIKYKIEQPEIFANISIRKYNILNEDVLNLSPDTTPKLIVYNKQNIGRDIKIDQVFNFMKDIQKGESEQSVHDTMVEQIIQRMMKEVKTE